MLACACRSVWGAGETHTHSQDMEGCRGSVFQATGRGGEGRRLAFSLSLKSECSITENLVGSQRKYVAPLRKLWACGTCFSLTLFWNLSRINSESLLTLKGKD